MSVQKKTILILGVNPPDTAQLDLLSEINKLEEAIQRSRNKDNFEVKWKVAGQEKYLRRHILDIKPHIIHFCGHGTKEGLIFQNDEKQSYLLKNEFIVDLLKEFNDRIECVVLNACETETLATLLAEHLNYAIGMKLEVKDKAAIEFSEGFYDTLGAENNMEKAFNLAKNAVLGLNTVGNATERKAVYDGYDLSQNDPIPDHLIPVIKFNPDKIKFLDTKDKFDSKSFLNEKQLISRLTYFTGREIILQNIGNNFQNHTVQVLYGLGGVGKTSTVIEYAYQSIEDNKYDYIIWIKSDNEENLLADFEKYAKAMGIQVITNEDDQANDKNSYKEAVFKWLENRNKSKNWLLIYDNVDEFDNYHPLNFIPKGKHGHIIITSRLEEKIWMRKLNVLQSIQRSSQTIELPCFDEAKEESLEFFRKYLQIFGQKNKNYLSQAQDLESAKKLAQELGHLPLALEQSAAYISQMDNYTFSKYLNRFQKKKEEMFEKDGAEPELPSPYTHKQYRTVTTTWQINFEQVSREASELFTAAAFLDPDGIPFDIFIQGYESLGGELADLLKDEDEDEKNDLMQEMLRELSKFSLVKWRGLGNKFTIHRLVQAATRFNLKESDQEKYKSTLNNVLNCLCSSDTSDISQWAISLEWAIGDGTWENHQKLFPHAQSALRYAEKDQIVSESVSSLNFFVANYFGTNLIYEDSIKFYEKAIINQASIKGYCGITHIKKYIEHLNSSDNNLLNNNEYCILENLVLIYRRLRMFEEAMQILPLLERYIQEVTVENKYHNCLKVSVLKMWGCVYQDQNLYEQAEKALKNGIELAESFLKKFIGTAIPTLEKLFELNIDPEDEKIANYLIFLRASTLNSLGNCYRFWGKNQNAIDCAEESIKSYWQNFNQEGSPGYLGYQRHRYNLAKAYANNRNYEIAEKIQIEVLKARRKILNVENDKHPVIVSSLSALGVLYRDWANTLRNENAQKKEYQDLALEYLTKAYEINKEFMSLTNHTIEPLLINLFSIYEQMNLLELWKEILEEVKEACEKNKPEPKHLGFVYRNLGLYYGKKGNHEQEKEWLKEAIKTDKKLRPDNFTAICESIKRLGYFYYYTCEDYKLAIQEFNKVLEYKQLKQSTQARMYHLIGECYRRLAKKIDNRNRSRRQKGKPINEKDQAKKLEYEQASLKNQASAFFCNISFWGKVHPYTAGSLKDIGFVYLKVCKQYSKAIKYLERAEKIYAKLSEHEQNKFSKDINSTKNFLEEATLAYSRKPKPKG